MRNVSHTLLFLPQPHATLAQAMLAFNQTFINFHTQMQNHRIESSFLVKYFVGLPRSLCISFQLLSIYITELQFASSSGFDRRHKFNRCWDRQFLDYRCTWHMELQPLCAMALMRHDHAMSSNLTASNKRLCPLKLPRQRVVWSNIFMDVKFSRI
jgi:hypothetical protein